MDFRDIEQAARDQGWSTGRNKKGHSVLYPPDGPPCVFSGTPGDVRSLRNFLALVKRYGLKWPWTAQDRRDRRRGERQ